ncbi:MAG TPA: hypothetical protein VF288_04240 [Mycobacteriales bacterium]
MSTEVQPRAAAAGRVQIAERTLRQDRWWLQPLITFAVLGAFVVYSTFRAFWGRYYYDDHSHLLSPLYSPCLSDRCGTAPHFSWFPTWTYIATPAIWVLIFPLGLRLSCYYYRKAYYRSFWFSPPACAVSEPHKGYSGETRFPLVMQNVHRWFFWFGLLFVGILTFDAVESFRQGASGQWGHMGLGSVILIVDALLLGLYTISCHSCRHIFGGRLRNFSKHPVRYRLWSWVTVLNAKHMQFAWVSLVFVALTDLYVWLVTANVFSDPRFF